jgi:PAS domain S-box-containing protein
VLIVDGHGGVRACGESLAQLLGVDADELVGRSVWTLLPGWTPYNGKDSECSLQLSHLRTGVPVEVSRDSLHLQRETFFMLEVRVLFQPAPPDAVMVTDGRGDILHVNPAFEAMTGYSSRELEGRTPAVLKSEAHGLGHYRELWSTLLDGRVYRGAFINRRKNGELYHESKVIRPVLDGDGRPLLFLCSGCELAMPALWTGAPQRPWIAL